MTVLEKILEEINWCNDTHQRHVTAFISDDCCYDKSLTNFQVGLLNEFGQGIEYLNVTLGTVDASAVLARLKELDMVVVFNNYKIPK